MKILALDVGKSSTAVCVYDSVKMRHEYNAVKTNWASLDKLVCQYQPERVVLEIGPTTGWIYDLICVKDIEVQVANPNHEAWRWRKVKRKTDRMDALKLAQLSAMSQLPTVYMPNKPVRQWRQLIRYRHRIMDRRVAVKCTIKAILLRENIEWAPGKSGWTQRMISKLEAMALPLSQTSMDELWRGQLFIALEELRSIQCLIDQLDKRLNKIGDKNPRVGLLRTIPGVGARLAEMVVAMIDDPHRFKNSSQVASYSGLVPKQLHSGNIKITGHVSKQGDNLLRKLLVEVSWIGLMHNPWIRQQYKQLQRGSKNRNKLAIVAIARKLFVRCWSMLKSDTPWEPPVQVQI